MSSDLPVGHSKGSVADPRSEAARRESAIQALIRQRNEAIDDLATMTEVARGNQRHVKYLTEENERLRAEVARVRAQVAEGLRPLIKALTGVYDTWFLVGEMATVEDSNAMHAAADAVLPHLVQLRRFLSEAPNAPAESVVAAPTDQAGTAELDGAVHSVWLHGDWRWLTRKMTTEQREAFADAVDRHWGTSDDGEPRRPAYRWWREPVGALPEDEGTRQEGLIDGD